MLGFPASIISAFAVLAATGLAAAVELTSAERPPGLCSVKVDFGSYCCGYDAEVEKRIIAYVRASELIAQAVEYPWGMEGEHSLCLRIPDAKVARHIYEALKVFIPAESTKAWTSVWVNTGESFQTTWPK